ncbi:MAG: YqeG family HAD IIIA-type phosphatase [Firmicutes bacterium]|nr:YqeG family HAD IIIA-type phosphatase [Bacillota bacterium]
MLRILYPNMYVPSVTAINPQELRERGIHNLLLDLDNTIVPRDHNRFSPQINNWLQGLMDKGFKLCIVSNNSTGRVKNVAGPLQVPTVVRAVKPLPGAFLRGMRLLGAKTGNTAIIGDQIFTDILGGNMLGLFTVLVVPLPGKEFWVTKMVNRRLEKLILYDISRRVSHKDKMYHVR